MTRGGRRLSLTIFEWSVAGSCQSPVTREFFARKDREPRKRDNPWAPGDDAPLTLIMHLRCRRCQDCMRLRRRDWYLRAGIELSRASRTWFGTLTLNPEATFRCEVLARRRLLSGGTVWESLTPEDRYGETCQEIGRELTLYLKRLRKHSGAGLKYFACFEKHRSGFPHLHMLVHEYPPAELKKRHLDFQWKLGFSHWRLVPDGGGQSAARYVAKYITKDGGRVRSSVRYGKPENVLEHSVPQGTACAKHSRPSSRRFSLGDCVTDICETAEW